MSIADAAATGDRRLALEAMRGKLAADMDVAPPAVVAQIAGRLAAILQELDGLPTQGKVSTLDELERRRVDRLAKAVKSPSAKRPTRQRRVGSG